MSWDLEICMKNDSLMRLAYYSRKFTCWINALITLCHTHSGSGVYFLLNSDNLQICNREGIQKHFWQNFLDVCHFPYRLVCCLAVRVSG